MKRNRRANIGTITCLVGALAPLAWAGVAEAAVPAASGEGVRSEIGLRTTVAQSDNMGRDEFEESGTVGSVGTTVDVLREGSRLNWSMNGALDYYDYSASRYDSELLGDMRANVTAALIPERLDWVVDGDYGQLSSDPYRPEGPDNRGSVAVLQTGPNITLPIDPRTYAQVSARYSQRSFDEDGRVDSDVTSGELGLHRNLSATRQLGLVTSTRRVEYDSATADPYEVYGAYLSYAQEFETGSLSLDVGANQLKFGGEGDTGLLLRAEYDRGITARSTLSLRASQEFQDAGNMSSGRLPPDSNDPEASVAATADPFTRTLVGASYLTNWDRTSFRISAGLSENEYENEQRFDTRNTTFGVSGTRELSPVMRMSVGLHLRHEDFQDEDLETDEWRPYMEVTRELGDRLDLSLRVESWDRESDQQKNFTENRALLTLTYYPFQR